MQKKGQNRYKTLFLLFLLFIIGFLLSSNYSKIIGMVVAAPTILNPSFEDGSGGDAYGWTETTTHKRSNDKTYSGSYSLKAEYQIVGVKGVASVSDIVPVTSNTKYILSGYFYNLLTQGYAYLDIYDPVKGFDPSYECNAYSRNNRDEWQYITCEFTTPVDTTKIKIRFVTDYSPIGTVWLDSVSVIPKIAKGFPVVNYLTSEGYLASFILNDVKQEYYALVMLDEINLIRKELGLPLRTEGEIRDQLHKKTQQDLEQ